MLDRNQLMIREDRSAMTSYQPPLSVPNAPSASSQPGLLQVIGRHPVLIVFMVALSLGAAFFYLKKATPIYTSTAEVLIQQNSPVHVGQDFGATGGQNWLATQAAIITSSPVLQRVLDMPGVKEMKTFSKSDNPLVYLEKITDVEQSKHNDLIDVSVDSPYADEAADLANDVVDAYKRFELYEKTNTALEFLNVMKKDRDKADGELEELIRQQQEFRTLNPEITMGDNATNVITQRLLRLADAYTSAQLETQRARATYAPGHPAVTKAIANEEQIYNMYEEQKQLAIKLDAKRGQYGRLESDIQIKRSELNTKNQRVAEAELSANNQMPNITVVNPAMVETKASSPQKTKTMAIALVTGLVLGGGCALLRDVLDQRVRSAEEVRALMGVPILGVVPKMAGRQTAVARAMTVHLEPKSVVAEAYRTVRTAIYFAVPEGQAKTILMTSPAPGDGKTTSASNLAIAIAQTGRRALLLDADFRKPTQHKNLDVKDDIGLSSVLAGKEPIERAIQRTGVEGLDILPCGPIPANPSEILNSQAFANLVQRLGTKYDHILLDSPPVNSVADARILAAMCDVTILVLRAEKSTRKASEHARDALISVGGRILGVIVNDVHRGRASDGYSGAYGYYGNAYGETNGYAPEDVETEASPARRLPKAVGMESVK